MSIKCYLLDIRTINENTFNKVLPTIKDYRRNKIEKLSLKDSKYLSLATEILIKKACKDYKIDYFNEEIVFNEHGKPYFQNSKFFFNTSHSGNYAFCVIADIEVGCDIEEIKEYKSKVAERFFSKKENEYISIASDKNEMFYRIWTLKESYIKCLGKGFSLPINLFELDNKDNDVIIKGDKEHHFFEHKYENYFISVCLKTNEKQKYKHNLVLVQVD